MAKLVLNDVSSLANPNTAKQTINDNSAELERAFDNTLSRDGSAPNQMLADIDLNSNDLLNVKSIDANSYLLNGVPLEQSVAYSDKLFLLGSGTGTEDTFGLEAHPGSLGNMDVSIDGVTQRPGLDFNFDGAAIVFAVPPPIGSDNILVRYDRALPVGVASATGTSYRAAGSGAVLRTVEDKLRERVSFEDYGAVGDGMTDDTAAIQACIDANPQKNIYATRRAYKITDTIRIFNAVKLHAPPGSCEIRQHTTNKDHIMIGDGTLAGQSASTGTEIDGFTFVPGTGVANFTSGSGLFLNYTALAYIHDCDFYGKDGTNTVRMFRAITMFQTQISTVRHVKARFMRDSLIFTSGSAGLATRTVDVHFESLYINSPGNHAVNLNAHSAGIFLSDVTILDTGNFDALHIDSDPVTENGTNFFINNINIEGGNYATGRGIVVSKGSVVQIIGGWIGGIIATQPAVWFGPSSSDCEMTGLRIDFNGVLCEGSGCSIKACEISGDNSLTARGIQCTNTATNFLISGCRIKQFTTAGIAITGTPQNGVINGVVMSNIGGGLITGANYTGGPSITSMRTNALASIATAATVNLDYGPDIYSITGVAPNITEITPKAPGRRVVIQSGLAGITLSGGGGTLFFKGGVGSIVVPQFRTVEMICDGLNWYELGGNY